MSKYVEGVCSYVELPPSAIDRLNSRINSVSNNVASITPYTESKTAYIGDTEVIFTKAKDGIITSNCITENGNQIDVSMELSNNEVAIKFEPLEETATVSISIQ